MAHNKPRKLIFVIVLFALTAAYFSGSAFALGIGPAKITTDFKPNTPEKHDFVVVGAPDYGKEIDLYVVGDEEAAKYFRLSETSATLKPKETRGFSFTIDFPPEMTPGQHKVRVGAVEHTSTGGTVGARIGVEMIVIIEVPTPGKYLVIDSFDIGNVKVGQPAEIKIKATNRGKEVLNSITAAVDITNPRGQKAATAIMSGSNLKPTASTTLATSLKTDGFIAGRYAARAEINYDSASAKADTQFRVGDLLINILRVYAEPIKKDSISEIKIKYESEWGELISRVSPAIKIYKNGVIAGQASGREFDIDAFGAGTTSVFFDARGLSAGTYDLEATLSYENKTAVGKSKIEIINPEFNMLLAIALLAMAVIAYIIIKRKQKR